jgi:hypothetical protein
MFVKHTPQRVGESSTVSKVTIGARGNISFNKAFTKEYDLDSETYCVCYYDAENSRIGLEFFTEKQDGSYKVHVGASGNCYISCASFVKVNKISAKKGINIHEDAGKVVINLD